MWKLSITALNWGGFTSLAQSLTGIHLGGAMYTHAVPEGKPAGCVGPTLFLGTTVYIQHSLGYTVANAGLLQTALAAAGFATGYVVSHLGSGPPEDGPTSPVRHQKLRGFGDVPPNSEGAKDK